jgi:hypothetical protein
VLTAWQERPLGALLADHRLTDVLEQRFPTDGWSGARFSMLDRGDRRFVIKRTSASTDWIAAATLDADVREACLAASPAGAPTPYLGAAADGDEAAILMPDLSAELIAWERPSDESALPAQSLARVVRGVARLHADGWEAEPAFPWCPLPERLLLTSRPMCARHLASGIPAGVRSAERLLAGWDAFDRVAPAAARELLAELAADITPVVAALARLPSVGLHGDLKFANVALGVGQDDVSFIDWSMTIRAPVAVELGWMLVSNSASLPDPPHAVLDRYRIEVVASGRADVLGDWDAQVDLSWIVGLLLRGWRKGLDAESGAVLASGVGGREDLEFWCMSAVKASRRRL